MTVSELRKHLADMDGDLQVAIDLGFPEQGPWGKMRVDGIGYWMDCVLLSHSGTPTAVQR